VQDILEIRALQLPVFPGGVALLDSEGRGQIQAIDVPVICGGTKVSPGELVFGDADGMLQVPQALEADVLRVAFERITANTFPCASCAAAPTFAMSTPWCDG
jgi:regulator of RNase E activity RraA